MITPTQITNFNRTVRELQIFWLFGIMVAGKNSDQIAAKLGKLIRDNVPDDVLPFQWLKENANAVHNTLVANRIGQYGRIERAIQQSVDLDLRTATLDELQGVFGVGPKTARFFLLHSRPGVRVAVLDTHVLAWLREKMGFGCAVPKQTPSNAHYSYWENIFLKLADSYYPGMSVADLDLIIWALQSGRTKEEVFS